MSESEDGTPPGEPVPRDAAAIARDQANAKAKAEAAEAGRLAEAATLEKARRDAEAARVAEETRAARAAQIEAARKARKEKIDRIKAKLHWRAFRLLPKLITPPIRPGDREFQKQRDLEENKKLRVPDDFQLRCPMVWGVELYGPLEIENLYEGIEKLGWRRVGARSSESDAAEHIRQQRADGAGGWINLDHVLPKGNTRGLYGQNFSTLPPGVEALLVKIYFLTPSLTALVIGFRLSGAVTERYTEQINQDLATTYRPTRKGLEWLEPVHQKEEAVRDARRDLRALVGDWFARNLPGYFSEAMPGSHFPTMELLVAQGQLWDEDSHKWDDWRRLVTSFSHEIWSADFAGLQWSYERHHDVNEGLHIIVGVNEKAFPEEKLRHAGAKPGAYAWYCHDALDGILVHSATIEFLAQERRKLNLTRDRMKWARSGRKNFSKTLTQIGEFFDGSLGSSVVARELLARSKEAHWYRHDISKFTTTPIGGETTYVLHESVQKRVEHWSGLFTSEETLLRSHFEQLSTILSIRESRRAAGWTEFLTYIALLVAFLSLIMTVFKRDEIIAWIKAAWTALP